MLRAIHDRSSYAGWNTISVTVGRLFFSLFLRVVVSDAAYKYQGHSIIVPE
jgi:hypothetical protein